MAFQISPGINVTEKDLTLGVAAVSTSKGGFAGAFSWGPVGERVLVSTEADLVAQYSTPTDFTAPYFFTAAGFLSYSNALEVVRVVGTHNGSVSVTVPAGSPDATSLSFTGNEFAGFISVVSVVEGVTNLTSTADVVVSPNGNATVTLTSGTFTDGATVTITFKRHSALNATSEGYGIMVGNQDQYESIAPTNTNKLIAKYPGSPGNGIKVYMLDSAAYAAILNGSGIDAEQAAVASLFDSAPLSEEVHVAILSGGVVVEQFAYLSTVEGTKSSDGSNIYFKDVLNIQSKYVWVGGDLEATDASETAFTLSGGEEDAGNETGYGIDLTDGFALFADTEQTDISLIMMGPSTATESAWVIDNVAEYRKDVVVFLSPERSDVVNASNPLSNILDFRTTGLSNKSSSYAFLDGNWKYTYDRYNDKYRWVPCNGDTAGIAARTDNVADPWFSPAGYNRGQVKNVVKLAWNPNKAQRDELYKNQVNPIISQIGGGTILFGDKTLLSRPSAFDRINVRRLFIVLEKAIANAAKFLLFEFNDQFTRSQFRNIVEPFLRDVQGRRGIFAFKVVCDETNNTPEIIDRNEFVASILVQPAKSINFIQLNFVAVRTGVSFEEIAGAV